MCPIRPILLQRCVIRLLPNLIEIVDVHFYAENRVVPGKVFEVFLVGGKVRVCRRDAVRGRVFVTFRVIQVPVGVQLSTRSHARQRAPTANHEFLQIGL